MSATEVVELWERLCFLFNCSELPNSWRNHGYRK